MSEYLEAIANKRIPECDPKIRCTHPSLLQHDTDSSSDSNSSSISSDDSEDEFYRHKTLLATIPGFDIVRDIPDEYLHLMCLGLVDMMLDIFVHKLLSEEGTKEADDRITLIETHRPSEFQKASAHLDNLARYKGTEFRGMLLDYGVYVFDGLIKSKYLENFTFLCVIMRALASKIIPSNQDELSHIKYNAERVEPLVSQFLKQARQLYGPEFFVYNVHNFCHILEDYLMHGSVEGSSAFKYEPILGKYVKYIRTGREPLTQFINVYSTRLLLDTFTAKPEEPMD